MGKKLLTNLQKAKIFHHAVSEYDVETIEKMVCEDYIQHNPLVPTGRAALIALLPQLKKNNTKIQNLRIFQDADYVIMHHLWKNAIPFGAQEKVAFHIVRFDKEGLIAEHWSVMMGPAAKSLIDVPSEINYTQRHKVFRSRDYILSISEGIYQKKPTAFYDLSRLENDVVVESWSVYQEIPTSDLANENTMFNFPVE